MLIATITTGNIDTSNCFGMSCCQTKIPQYLKSYSMNLSMERQKGGDGVCGSAYLLDKNSHQSARDGTSYTMNANNSEIKGNPYLIDGYGT
ncbi:hypothetical protein Tco_0074769 [Tanacetum coccineum]